MTDNEASLLLELRGEGWMTPRQLGAKANSHHTVTLSRMCFRGRPAWVERRERAVLRGGKGLRPSYEYRCTPAGEAALTNHQTMRAQARAIVQDARARDNG